MRLSAQAKGAGMISPAFATMLCFVQTDAALAPETADLLLGVCVKRSFDRISRRRPALHQRHRDPDGDRARAACASTPESEDELRFGEALDCAAAPARAADRARRRGRRAGRPRASSTAATRRRSSAAARAVANSPLVKAALHGGDPNWGRIAQAVGAALPDTAPLPLDIWIEGVQVCAARRGGAATTRPRSPRRSRGEEVEYAVGLPGEGAETEVFFSDLSHEYVTINAEYTT